MDISKLCCGECKSRLVQTKPSPGKGEGKENCNRKVNNPFGMFVKEHFAGVKRENLGMGHKDVMAILSTMYREQKDGVTDESLLAKSERIVIEDSGDEIEDVATSIGILNLH